MKAFWRLGTAAAAASLAIAPAPLAAQVAVDPSAPAENAVGPAQLRDFSLDGTVIRRADPAPDASETAPARQQQPDQSIAQSLPEPAPAQTDTTRQTAQRAPEPERRTARPDATAPAGAVASLAGDSPLDLSTSSPADPLFSPAPLLPASGDSLPDTSFAPAQDGGFSPLPWLFAILLLGVGAGLYFRRQRSPLAFAGSAGVSEFVAPEPAPRPAPPRAVQPRAPQPVPTPAPPSAPVGIVSTRLRPWLDMQFGAEKFVIDGERATVEFEVLVVNSGSGPAREILVEAAMFNAGPDQDKELGAFFARPVGQGERVAAILPLKSLGFRSAVSLSREQLRLFKAGERSVFIPLVGLNVLYRWSGGEAQTSASFLIGRQTNGAKLGPFGIEQAPRTFNGLGVRELEVRVRK